MQYYYSLPAEVLEVIAAAFAGMSESYRRSAGYSALYVHHHEPFDPSAAHPKPERRRQWFITDNFESTALACLIFDYATKEWIRRVNWSRSSDPQTDKPVTQAEAIQLASQWFSQVDRVR